MRQAILLGLLFLMVPSRVILSEEKTIVLFDVAHHNYHTPDGRYAPFVALIEQHGFVVLGNRKQLTAEVLRESQILVISNASGADEDALHRDQYRPAFTWAEAKAVGEWVKEGGALLLIADHSPSGNSSRILAERFGVEMSDGYVFDAQHAEPSYGKYNIAFSRADGTLGNHPILNSVSTGKAIKRVVAYTGQSLRGPEAATKLLVLSDGAQEDIGPEDLVASAAGRSMGLASEHGKGRVVVLGEAAMLTHRDRITDSGEVKVYGIKYAGADNAAFAINIMLWLSRRI